jgi:hypothetical protein
MMRLTPTQINNAWADTNLHTAVEDLMKTKSWDFGRSDITPEQFSQFFEENYEMPLSPAEAQSWLSRQDWGEVDNA